MEELKSEIKELRKEIQELSAIVKQSSGKMNNHIDFVHSVYSAIRNPLNYFKKRIESFCGYDQCSLPIIEHNTNGTSIGIAPQNADQK